METLWETEDVERARALPMINLFMTRHYSISCQSLNARSKFGSLPEPPILRRGADVCTDMYAGTVMASGLLPGFHDREGSSGARLRVKGFDKEDADVITGSARVTTRHR